MLQQAFTSSLEIIINKVLSFNTVDIDLSKLEQKTLTTYLAELNFPISLSINLNKVIVTTLTERSDCIIKTSLSTLQTLKAEQQLTELIKDGSLDLIGDIKIAQQFLHIAESLNIDWQSELASHIGDTPTHKLVQLGKRVASKIQFAGTQVESDASEYLVNEKKLVVTRSQVNTFNQEVNHINNLMNEMSSRIDALTKGQSNT